ncbi:response regulator receiver domain protein [Nostoc sp. HK-01]|uniref:Two-component response regulator n=1 Tax=Nostoc cycadae WK-1 TaxID=1861711 RepID=A0A2H6LAZ2_9NOSO|nr:response regulator [Nostoc cycadae]BBD57308.1 response regulator receiver domain protein [Nostoc sp. HK-01]GBE90352.1 two-component response regulator [Nostoc cycadae WK-1]
MANNYEDSHRQDDINHCPSLEGLQILVVDDNEDSLVLTTFILESYGVQVTTATSALEALELIKNCRFDILIFDIAMPKVDGYSLIRKVRQMLTLQKQHTPAIALTALTSEDSYNLAFLSGFQGYIHKPVEASVLIAEITKLLGFSQEGNGE